MRGKAREARWRRLLGHMQKLEKVMAQPQAVPGAAGAGAAPGEEGAGGVVGATGSVHLEGGGRVRGEEINIIITGMREEARAREWKLHVAHSLAVVDVVDVDDDA